MEHRLAAEALPILDPTGHRLGEGPGTVDESACSAAIVDAAPPEAD